MLATYCQHWPVESHVHMHWHIRKVASVDRVIIKAKPLLIQILKANVVSNFATILALTLSRYVNDKRVKVVRFL